MARSYRVDRPTEDRALRNIERAANRARRGRKRVSATELAELWDALTDHNARVSVSASATRALADR